MSLEGFIKNLIRRTGPLYRPARLLLGRFRSLRNDYLGWDRLLEKEGARWRAARNKACDGPKVLISTSIGLERAATRLESLVGAALTMRGADVHVMLCDGFLPACEACVVSLYPNQQQFLKYGPAQDLCAGCFSQAAPVYQELGFFIHKYSELVSGDEMEKADSLARSLPLESIREFSLDGIAVGEHAVAGALRFFARSSFDGEPHGEGVLRRFFHAALLTAFAARGLFGRMGFECTLMLHGIYVPQGLIVEAAKKEQTSVAVWNVAYRKRCFVFSHGETYHHTLMNEPVAAWEDMEWTPEKEGRVLDYLRSRWKGDMDWIRFHNERTEYTLDAVRQQTGLDFSKPVIGLLTNVLWDAQLHYPANAFANQLEWIFGTIRYFSKRPDIQLVIRVHPAEITGANRSRQLVVDEIKREFSELPGNVAVISPDNRISTYLLMEQCNAAIIYGTKTGVELASMGIPVIVAGEAWIKNKGITMDAESDEGYFRLLDRLPFEQGMSNEAVQRARKYAYHFFFGRMIPISGVEPVSGWPPYRLAARSIRDLEPGADPGLDVICDGLLQNKPFTYPDPAVG